MNYWSPTLSSVYQLPRRHGFTIAPYTGISFAMSKCKGRTETICGTDCWTDHRLVVNKLSLCTQPAQQSQGKKVPKRSDVSQLKQEEARDRHSSVIPNENWAVFRDIVQHSAVNFQNQYLANTKTGFSQPRLLSWMRRSTGDQEIAGSTPAEVGNILSWRLIMKYFLRSFSPFRWFKKGSCQFLVKECAQYWLRLSLPSKCVVR